MLRQGLSSAQHRMIKKNIRGRMMPSIRFKNALRMALTTRDEKNLFLTCSGLIKPVFSSRAGEHLSTDVLHQPDDGISFGKTRDQRGSKQNDSFCTA